jgi:hypothetical protein
MRFSSRVGKEAHCAPHGLVDEGWRRLAVFTMWWHLFAFTMWWHLSVSANYKQVGTDFASAFSKIHCAKERY